MFMDLYIDYALNLNKNHQIIFLNSYRILFAVKNINDILLFKEFILYPIFSRIP